MKTVVVYVEKLQMKFYVKIVFTENSDDSAKFLNDQEDFCETLTF